MPALAQCPAPRGVDVTRGGTRQGTKDKEKDLRGFDRFWGVLQGAVWRVGRVGGSMPLPAGGQPALTHMTGTEHGA